MSTRTLPSVPDAIATIRALDRTFGVFLSTRLDEALREHDARLREAPRSALHGLPYSLKDMWDTAGIPTTAGSYRFRERVPEASAPVHSAFDRAGAVLLGKTSLSDLAIIPESSNYFVGATRNPHDPTRTSGGSSGGAAAAVAMGMSAFDWGSDFGGSIRLPAAYCGVYGMRLSTQAWPPMGMFPALPETLSWMNGQGPITPSLAMMRRVLEIAAPTLRVGRSQSFSPRAVAIYPPEGSAMGVWPGFTNDAATALDRAFGGAYRACGLPSIRAARWYGPAYVASHFDDMMAADKSLPLLDGTRAVLASLRHRGRSHDLRLHPHTAAMLGIIAFGRAVVFRDRRRAAARVAAFREQVQALWDRGWVLAMPTSTFPAPRHGATLRTPNVISFSLIGNIVDATALSIPFGRFTDGLPRGLQLWGPPGSEFELITTAEKIEEAFHAR